uniref:Peptidase C1A papain C-terminal domain-containing protein n=1 Tax=Alexandrium monilatum TaxID=311494 RepID=A0A7S4T962_9DINO
MAFARTSCLLTLLVAPALSAPAFEAYAERYGLHFRDSELPVRKALYQQRLAAIAAHNVQEGRLWTAGVNELTAATEPEISALMGYNKAFRSPDGGATPLAQRPSLRASRAQPNSLDWRDHRPSVVTAVKSQGHCGSCWAFAASAVLESHIALRTGVLFDLSPQQLNACTPNPQRCGGSGGCTGATSQLAFNYTIQAGINSQWNYPYLSGITAETGECLGSRPSEYKYGLRVAGIRSYVQLPANDARSLLAAVQVGPVAVSVAASYWHLYEGGIFDGCSKSRPILNHAVVLMGYGEEKTKSHGLVHYWTIRNSWSATWGERGYIRLRRYPAGEPCGVDDFPLDGYACAADPPQNITACGECGVLSDSAYPSGGFLGPPGTPEDPALGDAAR